MNHFFSSVCIAVVVLTAEPGLAAPGPLELKAGDTIAIIGNTLADRMQHEGTLEAMMVQAFPQHDIKVRNLAFAGDEITERSRSENFGSPADWLTKVKADVVWAFFGFNESFQGAAGLPKFKSDLEGLIRTTKGANYSGKGAPRMVLFSPVAVEDTKSPNFPDSAALNAQIQPYVAAMKAVAEAQGVSFVELFGPSQQAYAAAKAPLTVNGLHLKDEGYAVLAPAMFKALFGTDGTLPDSRLRAAVNEKSWQWHQRYRTVDGYNVYGGRSSLAYEQGRGGPKLTNFKIMQQEMSVRDVMTENRDKRVWAVAKGGDPKVDDSNAPPVEKVRTNLPGKNPDESHPFLSGEDTIRTIKVEKGLKVNLFADEKQFPQLIKPVQMAWDTRGRLWVAAWPNYPERTPWSTQGDSLLVIEDTDGDGRADKCMPFIDTLNCPTGFQFYKDGVLIMQSPDMWFVRDTDGDGKADWKERWLNGLDAADSHHETNSMCLEPGGAVYLSDGVFHRTQVETAIGPLRNVDGAIYRWEPRTGKLMTHVASGFANPHGRVFDRWGNDIITDATGNANYFGPAFSGRIDKGKHSGLKTFWRNPDRPCPGTGIVSSRHFPDDWQGDFLNANVIGYLGIWRADVEEDGAGLKGTNTVEMLKSDEKNFRPSAVNIGPDGALYFADWSNAIIGHMQHHIRDPNRDHEHGRIYRVTYEGRPLLKPAKIHGQPVAHLLELLKEHEDNVRDRAKIELGGRDTAEVIAATKQWAASLDKSDREYEHHLLEALWVHQYHNVVDRELLLNRLASPDHRARAQAVRVLGYWRDRVPDVLALVKKAAADPHPRVRLEAVRVCSFFEAWEAADAALAALALPADYYLDYTLKETLRQLEPWWKKALDDGKPLAANNPAGVDFLLGSVNSADLAKMPRTPLVLTAILTRPEVVETDRLIAASELAQKNHTTTGAQLLGALESVVSRGGKQVDDLCRLLLKMPAGELKTMQPALAKLIAPPGKPPAAVQQMVRAAQMVIAGTIEPAWQQAQESGEEFVSFLRAASQIPDPALRAKVHPLIAPLIDGLPAELKTKFAAGKTATGQFVRIELPRQGTLTLAEVEVISGGQNVARSGKAKQSTTGHGGDADRAVDGNRSGSYSAGGQTHTHEDSPGPWWELDLGREVPVESISIWNRDEGNGQFVKRLEGFTLSVLDAARHEVFKKSGNEAPAHSVTIPLGGDPVLTARRAAIQAAVTTGVDQTGVFKALAALIQRNDEVREAAQAMLQLPRAMWDRTAAGAAAEAIAGWARTVPEAQRTQQYFVETVQAASEFAGLLPADRAAALRRSLRQLSVAVVVLKTVREQMRYDTARLVVEAGKPFQLIFENTDAMPHNVVFAAPGSREEIGTAATGMNPSSKDREGRAFVPRNNKIIAASKLLEPGESERLNVRAPGREGSYEMVCTYPGHWMVMWGKLVVTRDVDAYLAAYPEPAAADVPPTFAQPPPAEK